MKRGKKGRGRFRDMPFSKFRECVPPHLRWMVDQDYVDRLGPTEREWLLKYLDEEYRASFPKGDEGVMPEKMRREAQNYVRSQSEDRRPDLMNFSEGYGGRRESWKPGGTKVSEGGATDDRGEESTEEYVFRQSAERVDAEEDRRIAAIDGGKDEEED